MNVFIITIGTRDVQFFKGELFGNGFTFKNGLIEKDQIKVAAYENQIYPEFICMAWPRIAGEVILDYWNEFKHLIKLPLIEKTIREISKNVTVDRIILVSTNQQDLKLEDENQKKNYNRDTTNFSEIIKKHLQTKFSIIGINEIINYQIKEKATNIDYQYNEFKRACQPIVGDVNQVDNIFLLPQGGIDQINSALTLQLIQAYGDKVEIWQQAEAEQPAPLSFTHLFLKDLLKMKIEGLVEVGEYKTCLHLLHALKQRPKSILKLFDFATKRKEQLYEDAAKKVFNVDEKNAPSFFIKYYSLELDCTHELLSVYNTDNNRIKKYLFQSIEKFHLAEFYYTIYDYTKFTLNLSVFFENFINLYITNVTENDLIKSYDNQGRKLIALLKATRPEVYSSFIDKLSKNRKEKVTDVFLSFPSLVLVAEFYAKELNHLPILSIIGIIKHLNGVLNDNPPSSKSLDQLRNGIAHDGVGVNKEDLINAADIDKSMEWWAKTMNDLSAILRIGKNGYLEMNDFIKGQLNTL